MEDELLSRGLISPEDLNLFKVTDQLDAAVEEIVNFYRNYHSLRFVRDQLVIRLNKPVEARMLDHLNGSFSDLLVNGRFVATGSLPDEINEPKLLSLPRIVFNFNRRNFGRLREMINTLNQY